MTMSKTVNIILDATTLKELKSSDYKLCFAKKVGEFDYNVVWQSYDDYLENNSFSWVPMYAVFGSNKFQPAVPVQVSCDPVAIQIGQMTTLDAYGVLSRPVDGGTANALTINNDYGPIHPGVSQLSKGIDGNTVSTPIYVAERHIFSGKAELTPKEKVLVWFEQGIETSTMLSGSRSNAIEVDLTDRNSASITYDCRRWRELYAHATKY